MAHEVYSCGAYINVITSKIMENLLYPDYKRRSFLLGRGGKNPQRRWVRSTLPWNVICRRLRKDETVIYCHAPVRSNDCSVSFCSQYRSQCSECGARISDIECMRPAGFLSASGRFVWNSLPDYWNQFTRYNLLSKRLSNRYDSRLGKGPGTSAQTYRVYKHPTGCQCQTGCTTGLTTGCIA